LSGDADAEGSGSSISISSRFSAVVAAALERRLTADGSHTPLHEAAKGYWNGIGVFVIDKTRLQRRR